MSRTRPAMQKKKKSHMVMLPLLVSLVITSFSSFAWMVKETFQSGFNFRGIGDFTLNGGAGHFSVIISGLVGERARKGRLQPNISSGGANSFSDAMGGGNIFRARGVLCMLGGARIDDSTCAEQHGDLFFNEMTGGNMTDVFLF